MSELGYSRFLQQGQERQQELESRIISHQDQVADYERKLQEANADKNQEKTEIEGIADIGGLELGKLGIGELKEAGAKVMRNQLRKMGMKEEDIKDLSRGDLKKALKRKINEAKDKLKKKLKNESDKRDGEEKDANEEADDEIQMDEMPDDIDTSAVDKEDDEEESPEETPDEEESPEETPDEEETTPDETPEVPEPQAEDDLADFDINNFNPTPEDKSSVDATAEPDNLANEGENLDIPPADEGEDFLSKAGRNFMNFFKRNNPPEETDDLSLEPSGYTGTAEDPLAISSENAEYFSGKTLDSTDFMNKYAIEKGKIDTTKFNKPDAEPEDPDEFFRKQADAETSETPEATEEAPITDEELDNLRSNILSKTSEPEITSDENSITDQIIEEWNKGNESFTPKSYEKPDDVSQAPEEPDVPEAPKPEAEETAPEPEQPAPPPEEPAPPPEPTAEPINEGATQAPKPEETSIGDEDIQGGSKLASSEAESSEDTAVNKLDFTNEKASGESATEVDEDEGIDPTDSGSGGGAGGAEDDALDDALEEGGEEAGEIELAGGGPEDPFADVAAAGVMIGTALGAFFGGAGANPNEPKYKAPKAVDATNLLNPSEQFGY